MLLMMKNLTNLTKELSQDDQDSFKQNLLIYRELIRQGNNLTKFLDTAGQILGSIDKIEKYRRAFDVARTVLLSGWSSRLAREDWNFGPDFDAELFVSKIFEAREKELKQKLIHTHNKLERKMILDELDNLYKTATEVLKRQSDTIMSISRNI